MSLKPPSPAVHLADPQWTSSDKHTCSRMKTMSLLKLCWESERDLPHQYSTSNWHSETQISSLELSPSCHHVTRWRRKAWCLDTRGFIPKKIQWHIHTGLWSLVNWWRKVLMRHYMRCSWILMRVSCRPYGMASALIVIGVSEWYPDTNIPEKFGEFFQKWETL